MSFRLNSFNETNLRETQYVRNKATVKKQFFHPLIRFHDHQGKQNQFNRSNLIQSLSGRDTVRKLNQSSILEKSLQICTNHPERRAQYSVKIEDETLTYCRKCATQVASQGFEISKIVTSPIQNLTHGLISSSGSGLGISTESILLPSISPSRKRPSFTLANSQNNSQKRSQLQCLTQDLKQIKDQYKQKSAQMSEICETFKRQKQTLTQYYSELISHIQQIMESHIQAIDETSINIFQVCQIEKGQITQTLEEIDDMIDDVEANLDMIIDQVDEKSYAECFDFYKQKSGYFSHRLQQLGSEAKPWPCTTQQQIISKIHSFKSFVNQLHEVHEEDSLEQNDSRSLVTSTVWNRHYH